MDCPPVHGTGGRITGLAIPSFPVYRVNVLATAKQASKKSNLLFRCGRPSIALGPDLDRNCRWTWFRRCPTWNPQHHRVDGWPGCYFATYFENLGKRLVKTPKVYWGDSGLACYLLGITSEAELQRSPFLGQLFEGFVAAEILKSQVNQGGRKELYYFRDHQGLEVDFLLPRPNAGLWLIECKAGKTVRPAMAAPLLALRRTMEKRSTRLIVVYGKSRSAQATRAVARGVEAIELERFVASLTAGH